MLLFRGVAITFQNGKTILIDPRNRNTAVAMLVVLAILFWEEGLKTRRISVQGRSTDFQLFLTPLLPLTTHCTRSQSAHHPSRCYSSCLLRLYEALIDQQGS
jgi:hypothetical protein